MQQAVVKTMNEAASLRTVKNSLPITIGQLDQLYSSSNAWAKAGGQRLAVKVRPRSKVKDHKWKARPSAVQIPRFVEHPVKSTSVMHIVLQQI
jgi:hypothetical protein